MKTATIGQLSNVILLTEMIIELQERLPGTPNLGLMYGEPGLGKSAACTWAMTSLGAAYVHVLSLWGKRQLLEAISWSLGLHPEKTASAMQEQVISTLSMPGHNGLQRPLIIDQADYCEMRGQIEILRDIADMSGAPVIMVGEEDLAIKLKRHARVFSRILTPRRAERATTEDAQILAQIYVPHLEIAPDLLAAIIDQSKGIARNIVVTLANVAKEATYAGLQSLDLDTWGNRPLTTAQQVLSAGGRYGK